jgi:hypothetical protein
MERLTTSDFAADQTGNNVTNHSKIKGRRRLTYANATKRPCNEVDQNLFHVDLPAFSTSLKTIPQ